MSEAFVLGSRTNKSLRRRDAVQHMILSPLRVVSGTRLALAPGDSPVLKADGLFVVIGEEKSTVALSPGLSAVFCSLLGENFVTSGTSRIALSRGDVSVSDAPFPQELVVGARAICLVIVGTPHAWGRRSQQAGREMRPATMPIPATYRKNIPVCRQLLSFARQCHSEKGGLSENQLVRCLMEQIDAMQAEFAHQIARCPGSSLARKRSVFMRLQRARNLIATCSNEDLDIAKLALAANYSIRHFITIFRSVFGETPYSSVNRQRLKSAESLLLGSELPVGEIAQSSGFFCPSSFTRAVRKHFGQSATAFRSALRNQA